MPEYWTDDPTFALNVVFNRQNRTTLRDRPDRNDALHVEAIGVQRDAQQQGWLGLVITPWALHLLCLPDAPLTDGRWPFPDRDGTVQRNFAGGPLRFTVCEAEELGEYHQCLLFAPPSRFASQDEARQAAAQVLARLTAPLPSAPDAGNAQNGAGNAPSGTKDNSPPKPARRRIFGLGG